jgi:hypothetical protein
VCARSGLLLTWYLDKAQSAETINVLIALRPLTDHRMASKCIIRLHGVALLDLEPI